MRSPPTDLIFGENICAASDFVAGTGLRPFFQSEKKRFADHVRTVVLGGSSEKSEKLLPLLPKNFRNCAVLSEEVYVSESVSGE